MEEELTEAVVEETPVTEPESLLSVSDFAAKIKIKYPQYKNVDDNELTKRIIDKYPQYSDKVDFKETVADPVKSEIPTVTESATGELTPVISPARQKLLDTLKPKVREILSTEFFSDPVNKERFYETLSDRYTPDEISILKGEDVQLGKKIEQFTEERNKPQPDAYGGANVVKQLPESEHLTRILDSPATAFTEGIIGGAKQLKNVGNVKDTEGTIAATGVAVAGVTKMVFGALNVLPAMAAFTATATTAGQVAPETTHAILAPVSTFADPKTEGGKAWAEVGDFLVFAGVVGGAAKGKSVLKNKAAEVGKLGADAITEGLQEFAKLPEAEQKTVIEDYSKKIVEENKFESNLTPDEKQVFDFSKQAEELMQEILNENIPPEIKSIYENKLAEVTKGFVETSEKVTTDQVLNAAESAQRNVLESQKTKLESFEPTTATGKLAKEEAIKLIDETLKPKIENEKAKEGEIQREELLKETLEETAKSDLATQAEGEKASSPVNEIATGKEIEPHKEVKASKSVSIKEIAPNHGLKEMEATMLHALKDKDVQTEWSDAKGLKEQMYFALEKKGFLEDSGMTGDKVISEKGQKFIEAVDARYETRKAVKAGTDLFPEDANIPEFKAIKKELKSQTDNGTIKRYEQRTADEVTKSESIVADIESKAESASETDLNAAIEGADKFIRETAISEADRIAADNGFSNRSELLNSVKKHTEKTFENAQDIPADVIAETVKKRSEVKPEPVSETKLFPKAERIKQLESAIAEIDAERIAEKNDKIRDFTYRDYQAELEKLKKKEEAFLANQETAKRGDLYKVAGNPFAKFEILEKLEATPEEIELGEQPVKIKNVKTGEVETVLESDLKKVEPKKVSDKEVKEKFTAPVVQTGGFSFPIDIEPPRNIIQKHLTKEGNLPKEVFKDWIGAQGKINSQLEQISFTQKDFNSAVKKAYGKTALGTPKVTKAQIETINDVLSNNLKDVDKLPEPIQEIVTDMRHQIDALSKELQRSGILTESGIAKVDENLGFYLTRSYRLHSDKTWNWNTIPDEVKIKAAQLILKEHPTKSLEQVEGLLKSFVNNRDIAWDMTSQGKTLGSKDLGILKKRKDIPIEIREFLGEYKDPFYNYATSVSKMSNLIERHKFLESVKLRGEDTWLFDEPAGDFNVKIAAEGSETLEPLNGLYTTKELAEAFKEFGNPPQVPDWLRAYTTVNSIVKYSKTILSPITHARNFTSNFMLQAANGRIDFGAGLKTIETVKNKLINLDDLTFREYYKELAEKRVIDQSLQANELKASLQESMKYMEDFEKYGENFIKKIGRKPLRFVEKAYMLEDNIHKIYAYEVEKGRYKYLGEADAKNRAAEIVRLTMPTYSEVPLAIRNLRRFPLTGTFVTFPYEIIRTSYNIAELAVKEMKQPETRAIGAKRLVGFMTAATVTGTLSALTRSKLGMNGDDEQDMRRFLAPWSVNSDILYLDNKGNGVYTYVDLGYSDPHSYLKKPANSILKGNRDQDLIDAAYQLAQPFIGEEILAGKLMDLSRNKKASSGGQVYNPELPRGEKWGQMINYMLEAIEPGIISSAKRISDAFDKSVNDYGGTSDPKNEIIGVVTGQRINTLDVGKSYKFRANNTGKRLYQAANIYNTKRFDKETSDKEKQDALIEAQKAVDEIVKSASEDYASAMRLGAPQDKLDEALEGMYLEKYRANKDIKKAIKMGVPLYLDSKGKLDRTKRP